MLNIDMLVITLRSLTGSLRRDEEGATAVEYGLMVALIAIAIIAAVTAVGGQLAVLFNQVADALGRV